MNTRKTIYDKLFTEKVELAKHEVELANIKDIPRKLKSVLDSQKKLDKSMPELEKLKKDVEAQKAMLELTIKEAQDILNEVGKKSKDLGLEPSSIEGFRQLETEISNSKSAYLK
jgi:vacuolar-type H+-ATPase subunit I/STV1